jgi:hypothetical protein
MKYYMACTTSMKQIMLTSLVGFNTCHGYGYAQMISLVILFLRKQVVLRKGKSVFYDRVEPFK